jgi:hypothetical protein
MVEELDAKGLCYTFTSLSKNNTKSMQQPDDGGLRSELRSGLGHFLFLKNQTYVPWFPETEERKFGYVPWFPEERKLLCFSVPHVQEI